MAEITEADRERAMTALGLGGLVTQDPELAEERDRIAQALADQREQLTAGWTEQFQAVLECKADPCTYCRTETRRFPVTHSVGPFPTREAAREHGWGMALRVYGSEHRVLVERRYASSWEEVDA